MGNVGSNIFTGQRMRWRRRDRRRSDGHPQPELSNRNVYAAAYTSQYPNHPPPPHAPYYQHENGACYPPPPPPPLPPMAFPESHDDRHHTAMDRALEAWVDGCYPPVYVDHQTVTINHDFNLKKETLKIEPDEENPGRLLVSFTFDASAPCSITLYFFAKEGEECSLTTTKEDSLIPLLTVSFQQGLGQKFRQTPGTGIDLSMFEEEECKSVVVKAESTNSQIITHAVVEKDKGGYKVRVVKQILWVEGIRYDLQEIYGGDYDGNDPGKECVICLSEPRDTTLLPCRHMVLIVYILVLFQCMCNGCAKVLRFETNKCPICRQPVERLLVIKVNSGVEN